MKRDLFATLWILALCMLAASASAVQFSAKASENEVTLNGSLGAKVTISGTLASPTNLAAKVSGPLKDYRVTAKERNYGIWITTQPSIVKNIPSYYQAFGREQLETQAQLPEMKMVTDKLIERGLYNMTVGPIHYKGKYLYSFDLMLPPQARDGVYRVDIQGASEQKTLYFNVKIISSTQYIKVLAKQHPQLYTALTILLAITAGIVAGRLRNGARQH